MTESSNYCEYVKHMSKKNIHRKYHDNEYGFTCNSDNQLFEKLVLEIQQAGLSWSIILAKKDNLKKAYSDFKIDIVSKYNKHDIKLLLDNKNIIRNNLKVQAVIYNAKQILKIQRKHISFKNWLDKHLHLTLTEWTKLFKKTFKFTGPKITKEFLMSSGYLTGAHNKNCEVYNLIIKDNPPWLFNLK